MALLDNENIESTVDKIAQAVIDRIEERSELNRMVEMVALRVIELQKQERELREAEEKTAAQADTDNEKAEDDK